MIDVVTINWNGGSYTGEVSDGVPHGKGTYTHPDADGYFTVDETTLEVDDGYIGRVAVFLGLDEPLMPYYWNNVLVYEGEFKLGKPDGEGAITFADECKFTGQFKNGKWHGQGTWTRLQSEGVVAEEASGYWKHGLMDGQGTWKDMSEEYVGDWRSGLRHGQGVYTTNRDENLIKFVGEWEDDFPSGVGVITSAEGVYEGEVGGPPPEPEGKGVMIKKDGSRLIGFWEEGVLLEEEGDRYEAIGNYLPSRTTSPDFYQIAAAIEYWDTTVDEVEYDVDKEFPFGTSPSEEDIFHFLDNKLLPELIDKRLAKLIMCKALGDQDGSLAFASFVENLERQSEEAGPGPVRKQIHDFLTMGYSSMPLATFTAAIDNCSEGIRTEK